MSTVIAGLGNPDIFVTTVFLFVGWLWLTGRSRPAAGLAGGLGIAALVTILLKALVATPGQTLWPDDALISQYFPSGHAAIATALYGAVAIILARAGGGPWRYAPLLALALGTAVALARVVDRTHPLGDAIAGVAIGLAGPIVTYVTVVRDVLPYPRPSLVLLVFLGCLAAGWVLPVPLHETLLR